MHPEEYVQSFCYIGADFELIYFESRWPILMLLYVWWGKKTMYMLLQPEHKQIGKSYQCIVLVKKLDDTHSMISFNNRDLA